MNNDNVWALHTFMMHNTEAFLFQNHDLISTCEIAKDAERLYLYFGDERGFAINENDMCFQNDIPFFKIRLIYSI